jgi:preprotein translocase subunit SecE
VADTTEITQAGKVGVVAGFRNFLGEVKAEMLKCTWPTKQELKEQTIVVCISCVLLGAVIWFSDTILLTLMRMIF